MSSVNSATPSSASASEGSYEPMLLSERRNFHAVPPSKTAGISKNMPSAERLLPRGFFRPELVETILRRLNEEYVVYDGVTDENSGRST